MGAHRMAKVVPVKAVATSALDVFGVASITAAGWLFFGLAGVLTVLGVFALGLSYSLSRS